MEASGMTGLMYDTQGRALEYVHKNVEKGADLWT